LELIREPSSAICTLGRLFIDGEPYCHTLEDVVRTQKIKGNTAIPCGLYDVTVNWSSRFNRPLPLLLDVPGFAGVRIHTGNTHLDTEGCILVGLTKGKDVIYRSREAFGPLFDRMKEALNVGERITIDVKNALDGLEVAGSIYVTGERPCS